MKDIIIKNLTKTLSTIIDEELFTHNELVDMFTNINEDLLNTFNKAFKSSKFVEGRKPTEVVGEAKESIVTSSLSSLEDSENIPSLTDRCMLGVKNLISGRDFKFLSIGAFEDTEKSETPERHIANLVHTAIHRLPDLTHFRKMLEKLNEKDSKELVDHYYKKVYGVSEPKTSKKEKD